MTTKREQFTEWLRDFIASLNDSDDAKDYLLTRGERDEIADAAARIWEGPRTLEHWYCGNCGSRMRPGTNTECSNDSCIRNAWIKEENEFAEATKENQ